MSAWIEHVLSRSTVGPILVIVSQTQEQGGPGCLEASAIVEWNSDYRRLLGATWDPSREELLALAGILEAAAKVVEP